MHVENSSAGKSANLQEPLHGKNIGAAKLMEEIEPLSQSRPARAPKYATAVIVAAAVAIRVYRSEDFQQVLHILLRHLHS